MSKIKRISELKVGTELRNLMVLGVDKYGDNVKFPIGNKIIELNDKVEELGKSSGSNELMVSVTWSKLKELRDSRKLVAGAHYRITDYECVTTQTYTRSAGHQFDIIVQALDDNTLSEEAYAVQHDGDEYFSDSRLNAWRVWYDIDNNKTRFLWASADVQERAQSWTCSRGVLESSMSDAPSSNYKTAVIEGRTWYLYRPAEPDSYLEEYSIGRVVQESITSTDGFKYELDNVPEWDDAIEDYDWSSISGIHVSAADGTHISTLYGDGGTRVFYDENDGGCEYPILFDFSFDEDSCEFSAQPQSGVQEWWRGVKNNEMNVSTFVEYEGDVNGLYYAFDAPLSKGSTDVMYVSDGEAIYASYYFETEEDFYEESIDWISYTPYSAAKYGGKGVIYRMIDEHGNDCPYDFKNIQYKVDGTYLYTFDCGGEDMSVSPSVVCIQNNICRSDATSTQKLPNVVMKAQPAATKKMCVGNYFRNCENTYIVSGSIARNRCCGVVNTSYRLSVKINTNSYCEGNVIEGVGVLDVNGCNSLSNNKIYLVPANNYTYTFRPTGNIIRNIFDLKRAWNGFLFESGALIDCRIEDCDVPADNTLSSNLGLTANCILCNCRIRVNSKLTINYANTTSTKWTLSNLYINASGWGDGSITIPADFPVNADYELKVAKNSKGDIKMWCDADLVE